MYYIDQQTIASPTFIKCYNWYSSSSGGTCWEGQLLCHDKTHSDWLGVKHLFHPTISPFLRVLKWLSNVYPIIKQLYRKWFLCI